MMELRFKHKHADVNWGYNVLITIPDGVKFELEYFDGRPNEKLYSYTLQEIIETVQKGSWILAPDKSLEYLYAGDTFMFGSDKCMLCKTQIGDLFVMNLTTGIKCDSLTVYKHHNRITRKELEACFGQNINSITRKTT